MKLNKVIILLFVLSFLTSSLFIAESTATKAAVIDSIPNTTRHMKDYDHSFLSVTGFASEGVNDRSDYVGTSFYRDRKSTRLNSSHVAISYAVFCLKKKKISINTH